VGDRKQQWANPRHFVDQRTRPAECEWEHTAQRTIHAHYRRWAWLAERRPVREQTLVKYLERACCVELVELHGHRMFPLVLIVSEQERNTGAPRRREDLTRKRGHVRVVEPLNFRDGVMQAELVLDWMVPSKQEERDLADDYKRQFNHSGAKNSASFIVVSWKGQRRRIPSDSVRRIG
jgi:hypothetical protein